MCFIKVKGVIINLDNLVDRIKSDQGIRNKPDEPMRINLFYASRNSDKSTTELNGQFIHFLLLIDVLMRMEFSERDKKNLIDLCKDRYADNKDELTWIREFEHEYKPDKAVWWYTRNTFLYKLLNKALRREDTELLFLFRSVIHDIHRQLKQYQCQKPIRVYRCQVLSDEELKNIRRSIGQYISINSFFSTSMSPQTASKFLRDSEKSNNLPQVLFIIEADPRLLKSKPFADISKLSEFSHEREVLFMVGCIFRLIDCNRDENEKIWKVRMQLAGDDENDLKDLFNCLKDEYGASTRNVDLISYGTLLHHMGKYDLAEKLYSNLRQHCPTDDTSYHQLCFSLAMIYQERKDFDRSLRWFQQALDRKIRLDPQDDYYIGGLHGSIAYIYVEQRKYDQARASYKRAFLCYKRAKALNDVSMAPLYYGAARMNYLQQKYQEALNFYRSSLNVLERHSPDHHPDKATNYSGIGDVYFSLGDYPKAMDNYVRSLNIRKKSAPHKHPCIASNLKQIGQVHEVLNKSQEALECYQKARRIYHHSLPNDHPDVIEIENDLKRITAKLK